MRGFPRLALATAHDESDPSFAGLALLAGLTAIGWRVQHFRARARVLGGKVVAQVTGLPERHLDGWLMPPAISREVFARGTCWADLAVVEGTLENRVEPGPESDDYDRPGELAALRKALDLPTIAVIRCGRLSGFHLPSVPSEADALIIDGLEKPEEFDQIAATARMITNKPVVGAVEALPGARSSWRRQLLDRSLAPDFIERLGRSFLRFADLPALSALARSRPRILGSSRCDRPRRPPFQVAYARDEAFGGYYLDTLEWIEARGGEMVEFSPLRSESLPRSAGLVMIGCGYPDRYAEGLAANASLIVSLKNYVRSGRRLFAEGGGAAYLGRYLVIGGQRVPGAGIFPFDAVFHEPDRSAIPVTRTLNRDGWLGEEGTEVRGYLCGRWSLRPVNEPEDGPSRSGSLTSENDIFFRNRAIGSLVHLHLAALPEVGAAFVGPRRPPLPLPSQL